MAVIFNAKGTTSPYFLLGKQGTTLFQGSSDPTGSYTAAAGDAWFDTNANTLKFRNSGNSAWEQGSIDITGNATISGNLTVNGTTTVLDTANVTVEDPLMLLASGVSGTPAFDAGFVIERGSSTNVGVIWDESADEFAIINTTEAGSTAGNVTIASYANIRADEYYGDGSNLTGVVSTLSALTDTTISSPADNEFLRYTGSAWVNEAVTLTSTVAALTDTTISGPSSGQVLKYNGSAWINDADSATTTVTLSEMTGDGSDTTLTLEATPSSDDNLLVFVDSVLQDAGAWSRSGTTLTFSEAPASGAIIKAWDLLASTATNAAKLDALTPNGSTTAFTLQQSSSNYTPSHANCLLVSIGGVMQEPGAGKAFTVSGSTITFTEAPASGATIWIVDVGGGVTVNTPGDDTVTSAKIVDGAIVNADINASAAIAKTKLASLDIVNADVNASAAIAASKIAGIPVANRNVMINGQFDVWQRGTSFVYGPSMTAHNYYMDRFRHEGAAWTGSVTQQTFANAQTDVPGNPTYYARWIVSTVNAGGVSLIQRLENYPLNKHSGKTYTVSVWLKSVSGTIADGDVTIYGGAGTLGAITTTWQKFTKTTTVGTQGSAYGPNWGLTVPTTVLLTSGIDIANFQVEEGSVATDFEQKSFSETLAECQRYYQKSYNTTVNPGTASAVGASSGSAIYSSGSQGLGARWITTMRAAPTVTLYTPGGTSGNVNNTANNADISATAGDIGENGFQYVSGALPNSAASGYRFHWTAEAEL